MRKLFLLLLVGMLLIETGCVVGVAPAPRAEVVVTAPYPDALWVPGFWQWRWWRFGYVWRPGYWRVHRHGRDIIIRR
ncbi:MAG: hypothetical protein ABSE00_08365 [Chitinispirillaceae bacterium]